MSVATSIGQRISVLPASLDELCVERTDVTFDSIDAEQVEICVVVRNKSPHRSRRTVMKIESAPLGAFVRWSPLLWLELPEIEAQGIATVRVRVARPQTQPLDSPVSAATLLAAYPDKPSDNARPIGRRRLHASFDGGGGAKSIPAIGLGELPDDPMTLLGRGSVYWAGNLNILIGDQAVERHRAEALRIYPGQVNMAALFVGRGKGSYSFALEGTGAEWPSSLYRAGSMRKLFSTLHGRKTDVAPILPDQVIETRRMEVIMLLVEPPESCETGEIEVHVKQLTTGSVAIVEFNLDPNALGSGCYTVGG